MKKLIYAFLVFTMILTTITIPVFANTFDSEKELDLVVSLGIMNGYPDGSFGLENFVSRAEFTKITINASEYRNLVAANLTVSPFHDVKYTHWAAPYIKIASANKLVMGYADSTFKPDNTVTFEEAITVCLRLLGYSESDFGSSWPYGQIGIAEKIGLCSNMNTSIGLELTRSDVVTLIYNLLNTKTKGTNSYFIESLDYKIAEDAILIATTLEDTSVGSDKIYTSVGTYKIGPSFNYSDVGKKGDLVIKDGDTLIMFVPSEQKIEEYSIYQALNGSLIAYSAGNMSNVDIDNNITIYNKSNKTTLNSLMGTIATGDILTLYKNSSGVIDYAMLKTENLTGPITVNNANWYEYESIDASYAIVYRDGVKCKLSDINLYDIAYYSKELNTIWTYTKKVTGIYESASPNKDSLTSVIVSGTTYEIESASAFNALSSSGNYNFGDTVTLLIGRNGKIADVMSKATAEKNVLYGYLTATGTKEFTNANGDVYTSFYADVVLPSGEKYQYAAKRNYEKIINSIVKVSFEDGVAAVSAHTTSNNKLSGTVNASSSMIGNYKLSDDVKILDVISTDNGDTTAFCSVFLQRIDGVNLFSDRVLYAGKNEKGQYNEIILKDVTGDSYEYGVILKAENETDSGNIRGTYSYDIDGKQSSLSTQNSVYSIYAGQAARFLFNGNKPQTITPLEKLDTTSLKVDGAKVITQSGKEYKLSDKVVVYFKSNENKYTIMPIADITNNSNYKLSVYYDKAENYGGRIRIIVAESK